MKATRYDTITATEELPVVSNGKRSVARVAAIMVVCCAMAAAVGYVSTVAHSVPEVEDVADQGGDPVLVMAKKLRDTILLDLPDGVPPVRQLVEGLQLMGVPKAPRPEPPPVLAKKAGIALDRLARAVADMEKKLSSLVGPLEKKPLGVRIARARDITSIQAELKPMIPLVHKITDKIRRAHKVHAELFRAGGGPIDKATLFDFRFSLIRAAKLLGIPKEQVAAAPTDEAIEDDVVLEEQSIEGKLMKAFQNRKHPCEGLPMCDLRKAVFLARKMVMLNPDVQDMSQQDRIDEVLRRLNWREKVTRMARDLKLPPERDPKRMWDFKMAMINIFKAVGGFRDYRFTDDSPNKQLDRVLEINKFMDMFHRAVRARK